MSSVHESDYFVLANCLLPRQNGELFTNQQKDKEALNQLFFKNENGPSFDAPAQDGFISLSEIPTPTGFKSAKFHFINNPDGTIRWLYPEGLRQPSFLRLYNGSGWRGFAIKNAIRAAFLCGAKQWVKSGSLQVFYKQKLWLDAMLEQIGAGSYSIFTGTMGDNRKAVVVVEGEGAQTQFFKLPMTASAVELVEREHRNLLALQAFGFEKIGFPTGQRWGNGLLQTDVKPVHSSNSAHLLPLHLAAIQEMCEKSLVVGPLCELPMWDEVGSYLSDLPRQPIQNGFPPRQVNRVIAKLKELYASFDPSQAVPSSFAHGDFTPWNCYIGQHKLHVYDWEMAGRKPLLFDALHFAFQAGVLIHRKPYKAILADLSNLEKTREVQEVLAGQPSNFQELYRLYLLWQISYYLLKYLRQNPLHVQALWQLEAWDEALSQVLNFRLA